MFICGSGSFGREEENERCTSPCSTPKKSKKNTGFCKISRLVNSNKNPYAGRGLDKFNALLAELDDKKQRIYTQVGPDEISLVRFVYPNGSDRVRPIVVKSKERNQEKSTQGPVITDPAAVRVREIVENAAAVRDKEAKRSSASTGFKLKDYLRHPYYCFLLILALILLFLVFYGRSFAILCTTIGWYLIPTVYGGNSNSSSTTRKLKRKKELASKFIVNREGSSSPTSVLNGLNGDKPPQEQKMGRRRSF